MSDLTTIAAGATGWALAIPAAKIAGQGVAAGRPTNQVLALVVGVGIAYGTTPLLSKLLNWRTPGQKVRGVALVRPYQHGWGSAWKVNIIIHYIRTHFLLYSHC